MAIKVQNVTVIDDSRNVYAEPGTVSMVDGFVYVSAAQGEPTGVPSNAGGRVPLYFDSTNFKLYLYTNNEWSVIGKRLENPQILNDISNQFDGAKQVFLLRLEQSALASFGTSIDYEVVINGIRLVPYIKQITYPWITPYDSSNGFRVVDDKLIVYNAPDIGDIATVTQLGTTSPQQTRKYPYSATTIAIGD